MENNDLILNVNELSALLSVAVTTLTTAMNADVKPSERVDLCYGARTLIEKAHDICDGVVHDVMDLRKAMKAANAIMDGEESEET